MPKYLENPEMWETLRILWASRRYATSGALHRESVKLYADEAPTHRQLVSKMQRDLWTNDTALQEELSEESRKTASQILSELGMGMSRSLELLTEIIRAPSEDHDRIRSILDSLFKNAGADLDQKVVAGALKDLRNLYTKGMELQLKALVIAMQYHQGGKVSPADPDGNTVSDSTPEEVQVEIERMIKSMGYSKISSTPTPD